jgi:hypothetical protein
MRSVLPSLGNFDTSVQNFHVADFGQILRPMSRLGGITFGRTTQLMELPRPDFQRDLGGVEAVEELKKKRNLRGAQKHRVPVQTNGHTN